MRLDRCLRSLALLAASLAFWPAVDAHAARLGNIDVNSVSGEPLRAEIELDDSPNGDASNGIPAVATPGTYRDLGLVFPEAMTDARVVREKRADGRWVVRVVGSRPVTDRGLMLVMSLNSPSGQHIRT